MHFDTIALHETMFHSSFDHMKEFKLQIAGIIMLLAIMFSSCQPSADKYFGTAALNCNTFSNFGSNELKLFLMSPPQTYDFEKKAMKTSTFQEYFKFQCIDNAVEGYNKVKDLPITDETRKMITASLALYDYCIPRYQQEYLAIAKMKDDNKPQAEIETALQKFDNTYSQQFLVKYNAAWDEGMIYAKAHDIKVSTVNTRPSF